MNGAPGRQGKPGVTAAGPNAGGAAARRRAPPWAPVLFAAALGAGLPAPAGAQDAASPPDATEALPDSAARGPSPAGAFLRGALVPGWGHTVSGAHARGAFYFAVESLSGWMLFKTIRRLGSARRALASSEGAATAQLERQGVVDPAEIEAALEADEGVLRDRGLVAARTEQREDWLAVAVFTLLVSGVDAFVSAHLQSYPEPLVEPAPGGSGVVVGLRVPVG